MSSRYIENHFENIRNHANAIEQRLDACDLNKEELVRENEQNLQLCLKYGCPYILLEESYDIPLESI